MKKITFRTLTPEDVECRVCNSTEKMINLLIYKNARVDMSILNDTVGMGWKREQNFKDGKCYCTVSIWDDDNKIWVSREDCGVESNTEAEKGQSSDAFKRACFNWGIGTELYTGPRISIPKTDKDVWNNKITMTFSVSEMTVSEDHKITHIVITDKFGKERFRWDKGQKQAITATYSKQPVKYQDYRSGFENETALSDTDAIVSKPYVPDPNGLTEDRRRLKDYCSSLKATEDHQMLKEYFQWFDNKLSSGTWDGAFYPDRLWAKWKQKRTNS